MEISLIIYLNEIGSKSIIKELFPLNNKPQEQI